MILFVNTYCMLLSKLFKISISVELDGLCSFCLNILINIIMFLRFINKMNTLQQEIKVAIGGKKLSKKSSPLFIVQMTSIITDSIKVFTIRIIILVYTWYVMRLHSDDQESGRQHPNIVKRLKVYLRIYIFFRRLSSLWYHLWSTQHLSST